MHTSVLLEEAIEYLNVKSEGIYVDATLGMGGHSLEILKRLTTGHLYCFDQDQEAIAYAKEHLAAYKGKFTIIETNFASLKKELSSRGIDQIDGILFDIGVSSLQFDKHDRGFSYRYDARLDMRMDRRQALDAYKVVNEYSYEKLVLVLKKYGEEKFATAIVKNIVKEREVEPIVSTFQLVDIIKRSLPEKVKRKKGHPAKKVFQALRIEVNNELNVFEKALREAIDLLNSEGRVVAITFHSLEDKVCKYLFKELSEVNLPKEIPVIPKEMEPILKIVNRKVITASEEELENNQRAHSAKMRVAEKR